MRVEEPPVGELAAIYEFDMGRRREDLAMWRWVLHEAKSVVEVGVGDWRVARGTASSFEVPPRWEGIESSIEMVDRFDLVRPAFGHSVVGDATVDQTWSPIWTRGLVDVVIVPYSMLYLVPHDRQIEVLRSALTVLRPGGTIAVEAFVPRYTQSDVIQATSEIRPGPDGDRWGRDTTYTIDAAARITVARRRYGPMRDSGRIDTRITIQERIYWREPASLAGLLPAAGFARVEMHEDGLVPRGFVLATGRA